MIHSVFQCSRPNQEKWFIQYTYEVTSLAGGFSASGFWDIGCGFWVIGGLSSQTLMCVRTSTGTRSMVMPWETESQYMLWKSNFQ